MRGLAAALATTAAVLFARTLVFSFVSASDGTIRAFAFVAAAADVFLAVALVRAAKKSTLAGFAALVAGAQVLADLVGLAGEKELAYELAASEPTFTLVLWVLVFFSVRKLAIASGAPRPLPVAAAALLFVGFAWRLHRMEGYGGRSPTVVWLSWATEIALVGSLAAMAFVASREAAELPKTAAGPYREPEPMPPPSVAPEWSSLARALLGYRRIEIARIGVPIAALVVLGFAQAFRSDALGIGALLVVAAGRAVTASMLAACAIDARAVAPAPARGPLRWTARLLVISGLCDLVAVFIALGRRRHEDLTFFVVVASFMAGLAALGMSGRVLRAIASALERMRDLERSSRIAVLSLVAIVLPLLSVGVALLGGGGQELATLVALACFAAFVAWCFAIFTQMRLIGELAKPRS